MTMLVLNLFMAYSLVPIALKLERWEQTSEQQKMSQSLGLKVCVPIVPI